MTILFYVLIAILVLVLLPLGLLALRYYRNRGRADRQWNSFIAKKLSDIGSVKQLIITPLVDWYPAREALSGEAGVSYLVQADNTTILLDVGFNSMREHPSPLLCNMKALGVELKDINYIVISHLHTDHVGGMAQQWHHTFKLSREDVDLSHVQALTPVPMHHATAQVRVVDGPRVIAPGVATEGPIGRALFFIGWTMEQSLVINVADKGLVIIIGCGHQGLERIVERAEQIIPQPLYGVVGGLHYPVTSSRINKVGIPIQRVVGTGKPPWKPITKSEVWQSIEYLKSKNPSLVAISAHDSCDWTLQAFRDAFGEAYQELRVGQQIVV